MDRKNAKETFNYFYNTFILQYIGYSSANIEFLASTNKKQILEALKIADSDIIDVSIKVLKTPAKNFNADLDNLTLTVEDVVRDHIQIKTYHKAAPNVPFDFLTEESQGTIKLFFIMLTLLDDLPDIPGLYPQ